MTKQRPTIIGSYLSPYVRKVLVCLEIKGTEYESDPIVPYFGNDAFTGISPLRRIPVLIDDRVTLADSTAICEYLNEAYNGPALLPSEPAARARSRWLEEFADTRMGDVFNCGFAKLRAFEDLMMSTPIHERRQALTDAGAPLTKETLAGREPRPGFFDT